MNPTERRLAAEQKPNLIQRAAWRVLSPFVKNTMGAGNSIPLFNNMARRSANDPLLAMDDKLDYVGYMFSAIRNRANGVAQMASQHLETKWVNPDKEDSHPYLDLIENSPTFTDYWFWTALSHFLDLGKGVAYLLAVRNVGSNPDGSTKVGKIQELKVLNPFQVQKYRNQQTGEVMYVETRDGMQRTIPKKMIIEIKSFNPFDITAGYAMSSAAQQDQYLNQQAGQYTKAAIKNNVGQRGLLTSEVLMADEEFANFKANVEAQSGIQGAGKFLYGNGPGSLSYVDMQIDLDKLALEKIDNISLNRLMAVTGMSRTSFGIEQSGVTRDTARVQRDRLTADHIIPQIQVVIDAFNQDYRNNYVDPGNPKIIIDNPLKTDREAEKTDAETKHIKANMTRVLVLTGFDPAAALEEAGLPDMPYVGIPQGAPMSPSAGAAGNAFDHDHHDHIDPIFATNDLSPSLRAVVAGQQSTLQNEITNIQRQIVAATIKHINSKRMTKNDISQSQQDDIIDSKDKDRLEHEIEVALAAFFLSMIPLFASQTTRQRLKQFGLPSAFKMDTDTKSFIKAHAAASAASHIDTVLEEVYRTAAEAAAAGDSRPQIISKISKAYTDTVSRTQATRIARTETNRSVAEAQYRADHQFVKQNDLQERAYKRWVTRSLNPCRYCEELQSETAANPIPFGDYFRNKGEGVSVVEEDSTGKQVTRTYIAGYEDVGSGTLHPNCSCIYELIIKEG